MAQQQDPYQVLGVARDASDAEIKAAFRRIARQTHPDATGTGDSTAFRAASDAYALLSNPQSRAAYDASGFVDAQAVAQGRDAILARIQHVRAMVAEGRRVAHAEMVKGLLWFGGGAAVSLVGYASAKPGGSYPVLWGAIIFGGWQALRAAMHAAQVKKAGEEMEQALFATLGD